MIQILDLIRPFCLVDKQTQNFIKQFIVGGYSFLHIVNQGWNLDGYPTLNLTIHFVVLVALLLSATTQYYVIGNSLVPIATLLEHNTQARNAHNGESLNADSQF